MDLEWLGNRSNSSSNWTAESRPIPLTDPRRCMNLHEASACARISIVFSVAVITMIICIIRAIQFHYHRSSNYHHYILFYSSGILACLLAINWLVVDTVIIDIIATFLLSIELLIVCHFYGFLAARILSLENNFKYIFMPLIGVISSYFIALLLWACFKQKDTFHECTAPHWIQFSSSQLVLTQLFLLSACYITRKLNTVLTMNTNRRIKKLQLWGLVVVFEVSSIASFAYDLMLKLNIASESHHKCDAPFTSHEAAAVVVYIVHKAVKYFLPIWVMAAVFSPTKRRPSLETSEDTSSWRDASKPRGKFLHTNDNTINDGETNKLLQDVTTGTNSSVSSYQSLNGHYYT